MVPMQRSHIMRFSGYLSTAEGLCRTGHENIVEQCIMASECGDICSCIKAAARAAHNEALFVVQAPGAQPYALTNYANSTAVSTAHEKRGLLFLGFIVLAIIQAFTLSLATIATLADDMIINSVQQARYMDFKYWSVEPSPPTCSVYMFWSHNCGAILSHTARTCSNGGTRLYKNSCLGTNLLM
jgi:hypothetical protein